MRFPKGASIPFAIFNHRRVQFPAREAASFIDRQLHVMPAFDQLQVKFLFLKESIRHNV